MPQGATGDPAGFLKLYGITLVAFLVIDGLWLAIMYPLVYRSRLSALLAPDLKWVAAVVFYLIFVAGLLVFVVGPAHRSGRGDQAVGRAALFGLVAYSTYDLTNLATLRDWPLGITILDMVWGAVLSTLVTLVALRVARRRR